MDDDKLVRSLMKHELRSLDSLITTYGNLVYHVVRSILYESHYGQDVDECVNDIYLAIWNNIDCYNKEKSSFKNWIANISKHKAIDYKRRLSLRHSRESYDIENINLQYDEKTENVIDNESDFLALLSGVAESERVVLIKRYLDGGEIDDIAKEMNINASAVYKRLQRGRDKIKKRLEKESV